MGARTGIAIAIAASLVASGARADDAAREPEEEAERPWGPPAPPAPTHVWYGWQTLALDGVAVLLPLGAWAFDRNVARVGFDGAKVIAALSVGTYVLGPPIVHAVHGRAGWGVGDGALRVVAPLVGLAMGAVAVHDSETPIFPGGAVGFGIAVVTVSALDAAVFAFEEPSAGRARVAPIVDVGRDHATLSAGGTF